MVLKIFAWFWIISGIIFFIRPGWLRWYLSRKSSKEIKWFLFGLALTAGFFLIKTAWGMAGGLPKIAMAVGLLVIIKGFFFLKAKTSELIRGWFSARPVRFYRLWAAGQILLGVMVLFIRGSW